MPDIREVPVGDEQVDAAAIAARLEELRASLRSESMSYGELAELQSLAPYIDPSDVELLEAAGVPEGGYPKASRFEVRPATDAELYAIVGAMEDGLAQSYGLSGSTAERARELAELAYCVCIPSYGQSHPGYSGKLWLLVPATLADGAQPTNFIEGDGGEIVQV